MTRSRMTSGRQQGYLTLTEGDVIDYTVIEQTILEIKKFYQVMEVPCDRAMATMLMQRLEKAGLTRVDVPQTFVSLTDPMNQIEILLKGQAKMGRTAEPYPPDPARKGGDE